MKISYRPSTSHWIFPPIILGILAVFIVVMIIQRAVRCKKDGTPFINLKGYHFFDKNYDKVKLYGTIVLFAAYTLLMPVMGFLASSIVFIFLYNVLYSGIGQIKEAAAAFKSGSIKGSKAVRSLFISLVISVVFSAAVWFVFGIVFKVTLP